MMEIGRISACIDGDARYTSVITVVLLDDGSARVERHETGACGGMDGPGGSFDTGVRASRGLVKPTGPALVRAIKECFDMTIRAYGKPTKNFEWRIHGRSIAKGLSAAKAKLALAEARS